MTTPLWYAVDVENADTGDRTLCGPYRDKSSAQAFAELVEARLPDDAGLSRAGVVTLRRRTLRDLREKGWFD